MTHEELPEEYDHYKLTVDLIQEVKALKESLRELIPIAQFAFDYYNIYKSKGKTEAVKSALDKAKSLL